jgi:hypothetical protein
MMKAMPISAGARDLPRKIHRVDTLLAVHAADCSSLSAGDSYWPHNLFKNAEIVEAVQASISR